MAVFVIFLSVFMVALVVLFAFVPVKRKKMIRVDYPNSPVPTMLAVKKSSDACDIDGDIYDDDEL